MSIDELELPVSTLIKLAEEETNVNTNNSSDASTSSDSSSSGSESKSDTATDNNNKSSAKTTTQTISTTTTASTDNSSDLLDPAKDSLPKLAENAMSTTTAKTAPDGSDLSNNSIQKSPTPVSSASNTATATATSQPPASVVETFKQKKKNLTLQLGNAVTASPGSELSSMSSTESNSKHLTANQSMDQQKNLTNGELVKHLDQHNISTPLINKYLYENTGYLMKTPGPIPLLTPNGSLPSNYPMLQSQVSVRANYFDLANFKTPCADMDPSEKITIIGQQQQVHQQQQQLQHASYNTSNANQPYRTQESIENSVYVNPNQIFVSHDNNTSSNATTNNSTAIPEYTNLNSQPDLIGNHQNSLMLNDNTSKVGHMNLSNNLPGNNYEASSDSRSSGQQQLDSFSAKNGVMIKEEFHTVPEHPITQGKIQKNKRKGNNNNISSSKVQKTNKRMSSADTSADSINAGSIGNKRRDTDNSSVDSHSMPYSPIDMMNQSSMKQEIKRARNREAARKCRTRKLEKIANLEIQVKKLNTENEMEKAKNDRLAEEINEIRQRLEMHQKMHNCDLKIM